MFVKVGGGRSLLVLNLTNPEDISDIQRLLGLKVENTKTIVNEEQIGRNDPCICGSGKKYKKCCGK
ncbi:SEC-C metal-binding domain-containing protein [Terrilactibacillus tamarindi]|uniref:SEC-C metal-binding domain-containing protein n=1 Tax=Terrilactibacillus tamarindi TaxID=2599694 RepID=UPI001E2B7FE4|nr:SEC-C metal-binding domain-containing protein [Terrilactibacillus tamarindi]